MPKEPEQKPSARRDEGRRLLIDLMENVEGGREILDVPNRYLFAFKVYSVRVIYKININLTKHVIVQLFTKRKGLLLYEPINIEYLIKQCNV